MKEVETLIVVLQNAATGCFKKAAAASKGNDPNYLIRNQYVDQGLAHLERVEKLRRLQAFL